MESKRPQWRCDRCSFPMVERSCKVTCMNCGQRWDCSDLTIWVGDGRPGRARRQSADPVRDGRESGERPAD